MNRYFVFYGMWYYPLGGMSDFKGSFITINECRNFIIKNKSEFDWFEIYDTKEMKNIYIEI